MLLDYIFIFLLRSFVLSCRIFKYIFKGQRFQLIKFVQKLKIHFDDPKTIFFVFQKGMWMWCDNYNTINMIGYKISNYELLIFRSIFEVSRILYFIAMENLCGDDKRRKHKIKLCVWKRNEENS